MPKRWKRTILYGGYLLLVTLPLLEIGVRMWGYSEHHIHDPIYTSFEPSGDIPYIHKPNLVQARGRGFVVINTGSLGLRVKTSGMVYGTKQPQEYRIAIVGDSVTFGEGVPNTEDTFTQILEDMLNQQQPSVAVKVFNFGVSAYSVKQMGATLQHRMLALQPDFVVMAIVPSDLNLARTPIIDNAGYLTHQTVASSPIPSAVINVLRRVHLMYVLKEITLRWFFRPQNMASLLSQGEIPESYRYLQQFKKTAEQHGISYLILLLPLKKGNAWGLLPARLTQDTVRYLDLSPLSEEFTTEEFVASRFDPYASAAVHHRIGEFLADYVRHQKGHLL
jgi:hypothetical protein